MTPLPLRITYADGQQEELVLPAEIWRRNAESITRLLVSDQEITSIEFDPYRATADADRSNNSWPRRIEPTRFKLFKEKEKPNHMRREEKSEWEKPVL